MQYLYPVPTLLWIVVVVCLAGVLHTYLVYPRWVVARYGGPAAAPGAEPATGWPPVAVLMAVHNEERVLGDKLATLLAADYPGELRFFVGSDRSTDTTDDILAATDDARLHAVYFSRRRGKPAIINELAERAGRRGVYVITDASVLLEPATIRELVRPLRRNAALGVVDARMVHTGMRAAGIGRSEERYIDGEVAVKRAEGRWAGVMMGPFGGCWAIRAAAFRPVPDNFLVDDFYLCMRAYEQGYGGGAAGAARVYEAVGQRLGDEFRRKVRISSGNWQNLVRFRKLWWPPWRSRLAFAFFSHKVLRWWTPLLLLLALLALLLLYFGYGNHPAGLSLFWGTLAVGGATVLDWLLATLGVHLAPLRHLRYFVAMNAALLVGGYRYLTGIKSNVWQPSKRH